MCFTFLKISFFEETAYLWLNKSEYLALGKCSLLNNCLMDDYYVLLSDFVLGVSFISCSYTS